MPRALLILIGAIAVIGAYFGIRSLMGGGSIETVEAVTVPRLDRPMSSPTQARDGMQVTVVRSSAEERPLYLSMTGRAEAARTASVRAELQGTIVSAPAVEGTLVQQGAVLCALEVDGRAARVREAEAESTRKDLDYRAAAELVAKGWASEARAATARASAEAARAALDVARAELAKTQIRAPFAGVFEKRSADVGDFLSPGGACGVVVQLDPIVVVGEATEASAAQITVGSAALLRLSDGGLASGRVRYIAKTADASTRAFRVEVEVENPGQAIPVGRVAEVRIEIGKGDAHKVRPGMLTADENGRVGVRYVDVGGVISFAPTDTVGESADGVWVAGLPRDALIVAEGQENVRPGLRVTPVFRDPPPAAPATPPTEE